MKAVFVGQLPFALAFGGAEVQVLRTADALRSVGVDVELLDAWKPTFDGDLLHCFTSECQMAELVAHAKGHGIPVVTSSIFLPKRRPIFYRAWRIVDALIPVRTSFGMRRFVLQQSDAVVALTSREAQDLVAFFQVPRCGVHVIGNGTDERFFAATPGEFEAAYGLRDYVLCVGSLVQRKNQHRLLRATEDMALPVVLIGPASGKEPEYARMIAAQVAKQGPGVRSLGALPQESPLLASAFAAAKVFALPSLTEGQPLSALQAAAAGANLVLSDLPYLRDTFGDYAWYCNPRSPTSIRRAIQEAYKAPRGARYTTRPPWLLSWRDVALRLRGIYESVLCEGK
jgi:glycosyltransferase involved in cell wall biosynthesis